MIPQRHLLSLLAGLAAVLPVPAGLAAALPAPAGAAVTRPHAWVSVTQTTDDLSQRLAHRPRRRFRPSTGAHGLPMIRVDDSVEMQRFIGAGGAMTDTAAWLIEDQLPPATRDELMRRLFGGGRGIHLSFIRLPIGASDFDRDGLAYTYDDLPPGQTDPQLHDFSIAHDQAYILPALRAARALDPRLYIEALPWSPPAWMKANGVLPNEDHSARLLPADEGPWARYLVRFLQAYAAAGARVSGLAIQNEPTQATVGPGLQLRQPAEARFARVDLRPALAAAHLGATSVFGWDLSWGPLNRSDPLVRATFGSAPALAGLAWHCYFGSPKVMDRVHRLSPESLQIVDECGTGAQNPWSTAELLIASLRHWANGIAFWNLALDPTGGPVVQPNVGCQACTGVTTVDPATGTYTLSRDFYELGQLTRFVSPGARRIASSTLVSYHLDSRYQTVVSPGLDDVALRNPDGTKVLLVSNTSASPITFQVVYRGSSFTDTIPAAATATFTWH